MFIVNNSESKLGKVLMVVFAISAIIGLFCQVASLLAFTKSRIGKHIRKGLIGATYDLFDESIDEAAERAPRWMKKIEAASKAIDQ